MLGKSYQSFIAPPPITAPYDHTSENNVIIGISTDIVRILDINEIAGIFHVQFFLHFSWFDSRYQGLHVKYLVIISQTLDWCSSI